MSCRLSHGAALGGVGFAGAKRLISLVLIGASELAQAWRIYHSFLGQGYVS
ncbi:MAG: hypothetical protein ACLPSF_05880 [Methylocella sp.]